MKFIGDRTLGKLVRKLRALGFDAAYWNSGNLEGAARLAAAEERILLTRSHKAPKEMPGLKRLVVDADNPSEQLVETLSKLNLKAIPANYFSRCLLCNEELRPLPKEEAEGRVPDFIYRSYDSFHICPRCRRIYWPGTHFERMLKTIPKKTDYAD